MGFLSGYAVKIFKILIAGAGCKLKVTDNLFVFFLED